MDEKILKKEREAIEAMPGVILDDKKLKGKMVLAENVYIEFDFTDFPSFKVQPRGVRRTMPPVVDLLPSLAIWDEQNPSFAGMLTELREKLLKMLGRDAKESKDAGAMEDVSIKRDMLDGLLDIARRTHPNESFFLLKRDATGAISEVVMAQGARGGKTSAYFLPDRIPYDPAIVGSFHSHPSGNGQWSDEDLVAFKRYKINIIAHYPFERNDFKVYDNKGNKISVKFA